jgi:arsenate reductase
MVTLADRWFGGVTTREVLAYLPAQVAGACLGSMVANVMFGRAAIALSTAHRASGAHVVAEVVATYGLLLVIFGVVRSGRAAAVPLAVGAYIGGAYFFTSSTSFANPAVTVGRTLSDTFAGIAPASTPGFIAAQAVGAALAVACVAALYPGIREVAEDVLVPHDEQEAT